MFLKIVEARSAKQSGISGGKILFINVLNGTTEHMHMLRLNLSSLYAMVYIEIPKELL